jgi:hypothetical protein
LQARAASRADADDSLDVLADMEEEAVDIVLFADDDFDVRLVAVAATVVVLDVEDIVDSDLFADA